MYGTIVWNSEGSSPIGERNCISKIPRFPQHILVEIAFLLLLSSLMLVCCLSFMMYIYSSFIDSSSSHIMIPYHKFSPSYTSFSSLFLLATTTHDLTATTIIYDVIYIIFITKLVVGSNG